MFFGFHSREPHHFVKQQNPVNHLVYGIFFECNDGFVFTKNSNVFICIFEIRQE